MSYMSEALPSLAASRCDARMLQGNGCGARIRRRCATYDAKVDTAGCLRVTYIESKSDEIMRTSTHSRSKRAQMP